MSVSSDIEPDVVELSKCDSDTSSHQSWMSDSEPDSSYHSSSPSDFDSSGCPIEHSDTEESSSEYEKPNELFGLPTPVRTKSPKESSLESVGSDDESNLSSNAWQDIRYISKDIDLDIFKPQAREAHCFYHTSRSITSYGESSHSDTEFKGEVTLPWTASNRYNSEICQKHLERFFDDQQYYHILSLYDYSSVVKPDQKPVVHYVTLYYKHDFEWEKIWKKNSFKDSHQHAESVIYRGVFYPPTSSYVNWPRKVKQPADHSTTNPLYCVVDWKANTTPKLVTQERFYTVFALKSWYHKFYNTATGIKFQCHPSEQRKLLEPTADALFTRRHHSKVIRYKYNFLRTQNKILCQCLMQKKHLTIHLQHIQMRHIQILIQKLTWKLEIQMTL